MTDFGLYFCHLTFRVTLLLTVTPSAFAIMVPETFLEAYNLPRGSGDRRYIVEEAANDEERRRDFLKSAPCVRSFLKKYIVDRDRSSFFVPAVQQDVPGNVQLLINQMRNDLVYFAQNNNRKLRKKQRKASSSIILTENSVSFENITSRVANLCTRGCNFIIILSTRFEDEESFLEEVDTVVQTLWMYKISRVVVLGSVHDSVLLGGSVSFNPAEICTPSSSIILDRCVGNEWNKFEGIAAPSLNRCVVKLAYFEMYPYVIARNDTEELGGTEGAMTEEIMKRLKVEVERERVTWHENDTFIEELRSLLMNDSQVDLVIGGILWQLHKDIDFTSTYETTKIVWMIPVTPNVSLRGLVEPFDKYVWAAVAGALLLGGVVRIFLLPDITFLDIFALIIGVSTSRQPTKTANRIQFISWSIFGLFLTQLYVDSLADQLMNASDAQIETMSELIASKLQIGGTVNFKDLFDDDETDETIKAINKRFIVLDHDDYLNHLADLLAGRNDTLAMIVMLNSSRSNAMDLKGVRVMKESMGNYPLALATWSGLPFLREINSVIRDAIEFGLVDFWSRRAAAITDNYDEADGDIEEDEESRNQLHIQEFAPAFLLLIIGFGSGFCLLIIEIIAYPSKYLQ